MLLLKPFLGCNLNCKYCYEKAYRDKYKPKKDYNLNDILRRMDEFKNLEMSLHGGEPLLLGKKDVKTLLAKMYEYNKKSAIQTNGTLIDDDYIKMFKKYKTNVGISWDGPGELSAYRPGTEKLEETFKRLIKEEVSVSTIIVISKANAGNKAKLEKFKKYLLELNKMGISGRINPCYGSPGYELSISKLQKVYLELAKFLLYHGLRWSPFIDIIKGLKGESRVCTLMGCDPFHTESATVVLNDGSLSNCMRTNREKVLLRANSKYNTRDEILQNVEQKYKGCKDCKYWSACHGGCPMGAIDNDWRNRTYLCPVWKTLFEFYEKLLTCLQVPLSFNSTCQQSKNGQQTGHGDSPHGDSHGDHSDGHEDLPTHQDARHGDSPHGDSHGDHSDEGQEKHGDSPHGDSHGDSG